MFNCCKVALALGIAAFLIGCTIFDDAGVHARITNNSGKKVEVVYISKGPFDAGTSKQLNFSAGETTTVDLISEFGPDPRNPFPSDFTLSAGTQHREVKRAGGRWGPATAKSFATYGYGASYRYQIEPDLRIYMIPPDCETPCKRLYPQPIGYPL